MMRGSAPVHERLPDQRADTLAGAAAEKLWRYNQHCFDDLNAQGAATRRDWHGGAYCMAVSLNGGRAVTRWQWQ
jgi:hypothetical protein